MRLVTIIMMMTACYCSHAQQPVITNPQEQALETLAEKEETDIEDDDLLQQLEAFRQHPVNLNTATQDELQMLQMLNGLQVKALVQYRALLGKFIDIRELQAIPHWDVETIRRVLPYVTIAEPALKVSQLTGLFKNLKNGAGILLVGMSQSLNNTTGSTEEYPGSPQKMLVRYRYNYKGLVQFGVLGEKDAGESLRKGFDFYSFHLFLRKAGIIQSLAIGDFTVNMGQGLIHWQSLSLRKSSEVTTGKRQSALLRPYSSAGEYNFHRGAGISLQKKGLSFTAFASSRKLDANLSPGAANDEPVITSFLTSGLHRTPAELVERNNISQQAWGGVIAYDRPSWHVAGNIIHYNFSNPVQKKDEPYNLFAFRGKQLTNYSLDYDHTWRNVHLFGELAAARQGGRALVQGMLVSLDRKVDASLVFRHLSPGFQSLYASAFTENTLPSNESGLFLGLALKPGRGYTINIYADVFHFPWLRFRADAPSGGREYLVQLAWQPNKRVELSTRLRHESKESNQSSDEPFAFIGPVRKLNWRTHINWQLSPATRLRQRMELVWFNANGAAEQGFLIYNDISCNPAGKPFGFGGRLQFFETDGFNSRIYAFENDAAAGYAVHAAYHKGLQYYLNFFMNFKGLHVNRRVTNALNIKLYLRWAQTINQMKTGPASPGGDIQSPGVYKIQVVFSSY